MERGRSKDLPSGRASSGVYVVMEIRGGGENVKTSICLKIL